MVRFTRSRHANAHSVASLDDAFRFERAAPEDPELKGGRYHHATAMRLHYEATLQAEEGQPARINIPAAADPAHSWMRLRTAVISVPYHHSAAFGYRDESTYPDVARRGTGARTVAALLMLLLLVTAEFALHYTRPKRSAL